MKNVHRTYSLRILVTGLVLVFMILIMMMNIIAIYSMNVQFNKMDLVKKMILFEIPLFILSPITTFILVDKVASPLRRLSIYVKQLASGDMQSPVPEFITPNNEINELDHSIIHAIHYVKTRLGDLIIEAEKDHLTGLFNRRTMDKIMQLWMKDHYFFSLIMLDIDYFKRVNDKYGHSAGDEVLRFVSRIMRDISRTGDYCCRYGGEEFVVFLPSTNMEIAISVAERLRLKVSGTVSPIGEMVTISLGVATWDSSNQNAADILLRVDRALYAAKQTGRNRVVMG
jgi:diguanylate cyclase (GGDEF)-like protein